MDLFLLVLFLDVIFKNRVFAVVTLTCDDFFNFSDLDSKINDTFSAGDILFNINDEINYSTDCEDQQLLNLTTSPDVPGETVVLLAVGLSEYCKSWISCVFECTKSQKHLIIQAPVNLTQEYDLQFEDPYYTANVTWMSEINTNVILNKDLIVKVANCSNALMFPSYTGRYSLDQSESIMPFTWSVETSGNSLFVSEVLNDTISVFNLKVVASLQNPANHRIKGTATSTIIVSVIDEIDECFINPCENNGTCVYLSFGEYRCDCSDGWSGEHCNETNIVLEPNEGTDIISIVGGTVGAVFGLLLAVLAIVIILRKYKKDKVQSLKK
ncbi:uncharacterized protein LOC132741504 [Ruditapes philippinarum]|uniref:uncharacterized protein LOC132741504 n=1 Tax=Ruditapes philippinarum TaxID=129788 RepID=UPI00295B20E4|nr:uncharacterized protein LOC132741504 [Ruditapes philippinarum]